MTASSHLRQHPLSASRLTSPMQKFITIGHSGSGLEVVRDHLKKIGLQDASPSEWRQLSPQQISELFFKTSGTGPLDYWKSFDPSCVFVFVYNDPVTGISRSDDMSSTDSMVPSMQDRLKDWVAYNRVIIDYCRKNPKGRLVVHASEFAIDPEHCLEIVRSKFPDRHLTLPSPPHVSTVLERNRLELVEQFFMEAIHSENSDYAILFDELQSLADIPSSTHRQPVSPDLAWSSLSIHLADYAKRNEETRMELATLASRYSSMFQERKLMLAELSQARRDLESLDAELTKFRIKIAGESNGTRMQRPPLLGAADRIRNQLSYRIGNLIVKKSSSFKGFLQLPAAIRREVRAFEQQQRKTATAKSPAIETYDDYHKACHVMRQLAYRLGNAIIRNSSTPLGRIKIPFVALREILRFKLS